MRVSCLLMVSIPSCFLADLRLGRVLRGEFGDGGAMITGERRVSVLSNASSSRKRRDCRGR
jgi:hypothetical protein